MITSGEWCWGTSFYHIGSHYGFLFFRCPTSFYNRPFFEKAFFDSLFSNRIALDLSPFYFMRGESSGNIVIVTIILITMLGVTLFITWFRGWRDDVY